jgi:surfeit locus 1 family protein
LDPSGVTVAEYIVPIRIGSRIFDPRLFTTILTLVLIAALLSLGRWQLQRADAKRALDDKFSAGAEATRTIDGGTPPLPRYQHVEAAGAYDSARQVLIDNMSSGQGRAGYYVITPFALRGGGWILVNRGWVPLGVSRAAKPQVAVPQGPRELHGRTDDLPRAGLELGSRAPLAPPYPVVASFPRHDEIADLLHERAWSHAADVVLLDPSEPDGYLRQWQAPGFPPMRHVAYAVQWFGLALTLAVIYVVTNVRRAPSVDAAAGAGRRR